MKQRFSTRTRLVSALLTLAMVFTFLPISAFAAGGVTIELSSQNFPDQAFREYLKKFDINHDNKLASVERNAVTTIDVSNKNISNLDGIRFFPNLKYLDCYNNQLTSLDVSQNTALQKLYCNQNQLTELDVSQNPALQMLLCYENQLSSLDVSQNAALQYLDCADNQLTSLDVSQNTALKTLYCDDNQLTSLDVSKNTALAELSCGYNQLSSLDVSQNTALKNLYCNQNQLTELDVSQNAELVNLYCDDNQIDINVEESSRTFDLSTLPGKFDVTKATEWDGGTVSGNTLTVNAGATKVTYLYDCGKNSSYTFTLNVTVAPEGSIVIDAINFPDAYFRKYLRTARRNNEVNLIDTNQDGILSEAERNAVTDIDVYSRSVTSLKGIEFFPNLVKLNCNHNKLTELDVSHNSQLRELYCHTNQLTSLDVSGTTALRILYCSMNQLTSLDVSQNTALQELGCSDNKLTSLDVRKNTNLTELRCYENQLTSLDVGKNTNLKTLSCSNNKLTSLDVRQNAALTYLACAENQLTSLDVSKNTQLQTLYCYENQLTSLDVSGTTALQALYCYKNQLTSLDMSKNTKLSKLECYQNHLTSLDVSQTAVTELKAISNRITIEVEETSRTFDLRTLPGKFDVSKATNWNGGTVSGNTLKVNEGVNQVTYTYNCGKGCNATFTLNVKVVPDGTVTPPTPGGDTPGGTTPGGDTPGGTTPGGGGGGAVVIVAAAGAVAAGVVGYGVYNYVSGRKLQALLPEGVAAPENRAQTALLLWNTAGRPEPAEAPAFADVADPDTAKAAQWCVEQGLMKRRLNGKFAPGSSIPAYQVLNAYRKVAG